MKRRVLLAVSAGLLLTCVASRAQSYPAKPVRLIVPYAPGGTTDLLGRFIANRLTIALKQPFVVENRAGAGGGLGSAYAAKEAADGYTLVMLVESSHAVNPNVYAKSPYDPVKDFAAIGNIADAPTVLVVNSAFPAKDVPALIKELKDNPAKHSFASSGNGGLSHINGELFNSVTGLKVLHVPYKGSGPALIDLASGQVSIMFDNLPSSAPLIESGKIRLLAIGAKQRLKAFPNVPTYSEVGLPAMNNPTWFGLGAPAGTPAPILDMINDAMNKALTDPAIVRQLEKLGVVPSPMSRADFQRFVPAENERWRKIVTDIKLEKL